MKPSELPRQNLIKTIMLFGDGEVASVEYYEERPPLAAARPMPSKTVQHQIDG